MSKPAYAGKRRDANEGPILEDLLKCGFESHRLHDPSDALIWPMAGGQFGVIEIKDPSQPPSKRRLTDSEQRFFDKSQGCPRAKVETFEEALAFAQTLRSGT